MSVITPKVYWPLVIAAANQNVAIKLSGGAGTTYTAAIALATYTSAVNLAAAVQTAIRAVGGGAVFNNMVVSVDSTGHFVFTDIIDVAFTLDWNRGGFTNSAASALGFFALAVASAAGIATAPFQHSNGWYSPTPPRRDSLPIRLKENDTVTVSLSGQSKFITESELVKRVVSFQFLPPEKTYIAFGNGGTQNNQAIEYWWQDGRARFRYWPDGATEGTSFDYILDQNVIEKFAADRMFDHKALYSIEIAMRGYVA